MTTQMITPEELHCFKTELFTELRELLRQQMPLQKKWMKTYEVKELLGLSAGTLQTMRTNGRIKYARIGRLVFYDYDDIMKMMEGQKTATNG